MTGKKEKKFPLIEVFGPTIQGEGVMSGKVTMFVRFGACDYECFHCDSMHAVDKQQIKMRAKYLSASEIVDEVIKADWTSKCPWITLSGGNPALWHLGQLVEKLRNLSYKVAVETQGTKWQDWFLDCDLVTVSPKAPSMWKETDFDLLQVFKEKLFNRKGQPYVKTCLKVPIFDENDIPFCEKIAKMFPDEPLYLSLGNSWQPIFDEQGNQDGFPKHQLRENLAKRYDELANLIYQNDILNQAIFMPQLHVLIYGNEGGR